mmetsp:Transcript_60633/g.162677  ORF Transcript_60633/g.162677 Transcript_60633/m.162677 type:complete len:140 (+) Transcript_60633:22-441(+)
MATDGRDPVEQVVAKANVTREEALAALEAHCGDVVEAVWSLRAPDRHGAENADQGFVKLRPRRKGQRQREPGPIEVEFTARGQVLRIALTVVIFFILWAVADRTVLPALATALGGGPVRNPAASDALHMIKLKMDSGDV